jgi:hypothetical protein
MVGAIATTVTLLTTLKDSHTNKFHGEHSNFQAVVAYVSNVQFLMANCLETS